MKTTGVSSIPKFVLLFFLGHPTAHFWQFESGFLAVLILYRAFPHFMYLRKFKFRKRGRTSPKYASYKTHSLVWRCSKSGCGFWTFVCSFVCTSRLANFARGKLSNHDSKNFSEIRAVVLLVICLCKLQFWYFSLHSKRHTCYCF